MTSTRVKMATKDRPAKTEHGVCLRIQTFLEDFRWFMYEEQLDCWTLYCHYIKDLDLLWIWLIDCGIGAQLLLIFGEANWAPSWT